MAEKIYWKIPALLLFIMFCLMLGASLGDSAIQDELAHIPAGYAYVKFLDYRLNPEHPPLVKAIAGLPLLFLHLNFPTDIKSWTTDVNGQWDQGGAFLYNAGNNPDQIIFWARLPMLLLTIFVGILFYLWTSRRFGRTVATLSLFLFVFSPTFLAHGHYVTTDIGATLGFLIGLWSFINFLENPSWKNTAIAGLCFGIAELLKFSTFLLIPIYIVIYLMHFTVLMDHSWKERALLAARGVSKFVAMGIIGVVVISLVYGFFMLHYPSALQMRDSKFLLSSFGNRTLVNIQHTLASHALTRPLAHYFLGVLMVIQRAAGGNTAYFLGQVSNAGSRSYFPIMYLMKESLGFLILAVVGLMYGIIKICRKYPWGWKRLGYWVKNNFAVFAAGFTVFFYWAYSLKSPLNIGVRHVLPTFPFIYLLVSRQIVSWMHGDGYRAPGGLFEFFRLIYKKYILAIPRYSIVFLLLAFIVFNVVRSYPYFLSYFNALGGGTDYGYRIAVDSNYDWGQDLKRLADYVQSNNIESISLDYFGGGAPAYYLGGKFKPWWSARGPAHGYFAISLTLLEGSVNPATPPFPQTKLEDSYSWLRGHEPIGRGGKSIFIYYLPK
ncbi:MAG: glycosyltransferase family 39 protein [Candidatus Sungbacteria bacterium]|uniref:Glycosyltransferase family 39 protein n=1 Tax=Candidatus Sungiibacteriota bacterium TaxID=2750080 RepID=A0A9D6LQI0_9BACT|nr:glycosyltransferase family 39 protein [Candidatus Sungbacteria bacterium]